MPILKPERPHWEVERKVPLALIFSIASLFIGQTVAGAMWVASVSSRLDAVERKVEQQAAIMAPVVERSIRLETRLEALIESQSRVEQILRNSSILTYIPGQPPITQPVAGPPRTPAFPR